MNTTCSNRKLLETTKAELNYIVSCILQTDRATAADITSRAATAVAAKMAGAGVASGLLGLVSTFGAASTGTAIASLSGAAQSTATLYWVGSWVGGGVAWGAAITGGVGIVVGVVVYQLLKSHPRKPESFRPIDSAILNTAIALIAQIDAELAKEKQPSDAEMTEFYCFVLAPFYQALRQELEDIASRLDTKNSFALQVNAEPDFERRVIDPFRALQKSQRGLQR
jgi:hypothetical protein